MRKKIVSVLFFTALFIAGQGQTYHNEWIDYNKIYYKFKVGSFGYDGVQEAPLNKGLVRINQPALAASGLGNTPAEQFQLIRDGVEVPVYITKATGILSSSDYIEFWGEIANGKTDRDLYSNPSYQLSDHWNLETDSATYFLTVNSTGSNKRLVQAINDISSATIEPENNFMYTVGRYYRDNITGGFGLFDVQNLYSSSYEEGEGFTNRAIYDSTEQPQTFSNLYLDTTGSSMTANFSVVGNYPSTRPVKVVLNNDSLIQFSLIQFTTQKVSVPGIAANRIKNDVAAFILQNHSSLSIDEYRVATIELQYPRKFNFGATSTFAFTVAASDTGRYLKIINFNRAGTDAVLYDITNGKRYIGNTSAGDTLQYLLPPSVEAYQLVLVRASGSVTQTIPTLKQTSFINYADAANQGDYLIISNPLIYGNGTNNYVQQYSDYRSSDSGGHFNTKIIDIHQLEDQFAYGVTMHPLAIKKFLQYARHTFIKQPAYVFLIGKGVTYTAYRMDYSNDPLTAKINLVPVFGSPGSDNLLSSDNYDPTPTTPIGRLSAVSPEEVGYYLAKMKQYESAQRNTSQTLAHKDWMKKVIHLAGANDEISNAIIDSSQFTFKKIISDTLFGGNVKTYSKTLDGSGYASNLLSFTNDYNEGAGLLEYFGHSSSTGIDFSLDNPANYQNTGKYPVFIVNGCLAGDIFNYEVNRLNARSTFSEKFILEPEKGAIGYLATSSFGVLNNLSIFTEDFYNSISKTQYGKAFGQVTKEGISNALNLRGMDDFLGRMHAEQYTFHGDPALILGSFAAPDYLVDSSEITVSPGYLKVSDDSFAVTIPVHNIGRANIDSVHFSILRKFPDGSSITAFSGKLAAVKNIDSVTVKLPIVGNRDKGTTILTATIDDDHKIRELSETNNSTSISIKIAAADLLPVSPYNFSIVNTDAVTLAASTAYAFDSITQYVLELDTTALFNSPVKSTLQKVSPGGLIEFSNVNLQLNNTVYYWRVAEDSLDKHWNTYSFIHKNPGNNGFEQAHFFQHTQSSLNGVVLDSLSRNFTFAPSFNNLYIEHSIYPTSGTEDAQFSVSLNGTIITASACVGSSIIFNVFDPLTFKPVLNTTNPFNAGDNFKPLTQYNFEYSTQSASTRKNAMDFLDYYVQNGYYVVARKIYDQGDADWAPTVWAKDTSIYGHNNSLYHRLKDQGTQIDSFTYSRTFIFVFKKNDAPHYKTISVLSKGLYDRISLSQNIAVLDTVGTVTSPAFGPAKSWSKVYWYGAAQNGNNIASLDIMTIDKAGKDSLYKTIDTSQHSLDISGINAANYPFVQLRMHTQDSVTLQPYQLQNWSVEFEAVPEGSIATNLGFSIPDTVVFNHGTNVAYDTLKGYVVFKNVSNTAFSPLKINMVLYDENNNPYNFTLPRTRALPAGDTLHIAFKVNVTALEQGNYNLYLDVNPNNDQPEQYHYNNFLYHYVAINRGTLLPVQLLSFTAKPVNKTVQLQWNVTSETAVENYGVQFSSTGTAFSSIGNVKANSVNAAVKNYSFLHSNPVNGKNYYRLKMMDKDGRFSYSPIRTVLISEKTITIYPNPFRSLLDIVLGGNNGAVQLSLTDITGRQLLHQSLSGNTTLNLSKLSAGMYILQVNDGEQIQSFKIYKE